MVDNSHEAVQQDFVSGLYGQLRLRLHYTNCDQGTHLS